MSDNVRQISKHPRYQAPLDPDDPCYERDRYLRMLDAGVLPPPTYHEPYDEMNVDEAERALENLEEKPAIESPKEEPVPEPGVGFSICVDCEFKKDSRPFWKKWFFPVGAWTTDLLCQAAPEKLRLQSPITGESNYPPCAFVNTIGTCRLFRPRITYR